MGAPRVTQRKFGESSNKSRTVVRSCAFCAFTNCSKSKRTSSSGAAVTPDDAIANAPATNKAEMEVRKSGLHRVVVMVDPRVVENWPWHDAYRSSISPCKAAGFFLQ